MIKWIFYCYVSPAGHRVIDDWYQGLSEGARGDIDAALDYLRVLPIEDWARPYVAILGGKPCKGLWEIRFFGDGVQQRPIGHMGPGRTAFTFLVTAIEKDRRFVPKDSCKQAHKRWRSIEDRAASIEECFNE